METQPILGRDFHGHPLHEGRRFRSKVENYVVEGSSHAGKRFRLCVGANLVVKPTESTVVQVLREVPLDCHRCQPMRSEFLRTEMTPERPPFVTKDLRLNKPDSG